MKLFSDIPDYADTSLPLQTSKASQEWSGTGVSPVTGGTERTGETPVPLLLPRQGRQHDTVRRILWIVNHKTLMSGEVPLLRSLGFEVFVPKILPAHDRNFRSAGVTYDYDAALDHAAFFSLLMGSIRKNGRIGNRVLPSLSSFCGLEDVAKVSDPRNILLTRKDEYWHGCPARATP